MYLLLRGRATGRAGRKSASRAGGATAPLLHQVNKQGETPLPPEAKKAVEEFCRYGRSYEWLYARWVQSATALTEQSEIAQKYEDRYFGVVSLLKALLDRNLTFDGSNAVFPFESHDQAMNHILEARRIAGL